MRYGWLALFVFGCESETTVKRIESPPEVQIFTPEPLETFRKGEIHQFSGDVIDEFDNPGQLEIMWILDDEEEFVVTNVSSTGEVFFELDPVRLDLGEHTIELVAFDSDGMEDRESVNFVIDGAISAPDVEITEPGSGLLFPPGEEITFKGNASDNNTDPDDIEFVWTSDQDGELEGAISGDGQSVVFASGLSLGTHVVTLTATDNDGEIGYDTVEVAIGEEVEPQLPAEVGDLVFSELMINPSVVVDEIGEWVELYNTASYAIDIGGYTFHDDDSDIFELEPLVVPPKSYIVLCADMNQNINGGIPCDGPFQREASGALALGNGDDEVILSRPDGVIIDQVIYDATWFNIAISIGLDPTAISADNNDDESMWCDQTTRMTSGGEPGTPGRENDPCP